MNAERELYRVRPQEKMRLFDVSPKPIRTEADYQAALACIDELMDAAPGSREGEELDILADLVDLYETKHEPIR